MFAHYGKYSKEKEDDLGEGEEKLPIIHFPKATLLRY